MSQLHPCVLWPVGERGGTQSREPSRVRIQWQFGLRTRKRDSRCAGWQQAPHGHRGERLLVCGTARLPHADLALGRMLVGDAGHGQQVPHRSPGRARPVPMRAALGFCPPRRPET